MGGSRLFYVLSLIRKTVSPDEDTTIRRRRRRKRLSLRNATLRRYLRARNRCRCVTRKVRPLFPLPLPAPPPRPCIFSSFNFRSHSILCVGESRLSLRRPSPPIYRLSAPNRRAIRFERSLTAEIKYWRVFSRGRYVLISIQSAKKHSYSNIYLDAFPIKRARISTEKKKKRTNFSRRWKRNEKTRQKISLNGNIFVLCQMLFACRRRRRAFRNSHDPARYLFVSVTRLTWIRPRKLGAPLFHWRTNVSSQRRTCRKSAPELRCLGENHEYRYQAILLSSTAHRSVVEKVHDCEQIFFYNIHLIKEKKKCLINSE